MEPFLTDASPLVLGSGSPRRREILASARVPHVVVVGHADETVRAAEPADAYLARVVAAKLAAVRAAIGGDLASRALAVLVADTSVIVDGAILGKPADADEATEMIARLAGRSHEVHTRFAIARLRGAGEHAETVVTEVTFRALSPRQARAYAESGEGFDKAGGYAVQGAGAALVARISGSYTNVVGLPACEVIRALEAMGLFALVKGAARETVLVALAALVARLTWVGWAHGRFLPAADGVYYETLARRLANGQGYTWAWSDGAVTYAAHYPVGYPAIVALAYKAFGASIGVAGVANALIGALAAVFVHRLLLGATSRGWAYAGAIVVAIHPALVPYTVATMTEGVTAALVVAAAAVAGRARTSARPWRWLAFAGLVVGVATLVRPQSLLLAPALGAIAMRAGSGARARALGAALVTCVTLATCAPWTARNCVRMERCALVSVNGGWNLLIGAQTATGGWSELDVPAGCRTVWDEAGKDTCFERAAREQIARAPGPWFAQMPKKLAVTFDYFGAAPWYLHASNPTAFGEDDKIAMGAFETIVSRALLVAALVALARLEGARRAARAAIAGAAIAVALTEHAWPAYLVLPLLVALIGARRVVALPLVVPWTAIVVAVTALAHAVFFGAGRYGMVVAPLVAALAFTQSSAGPSREADAAAGD